MQNMKNRYQMRRTFDFCLLTLGSNKHIVGRPRGLTPVDVPCLVKEPLVPEVDFSWPLSLVESSTILTLPLFSTSFYFFFPKYPTIICKSFRLAFSSSFNSSISPSNLILLSSLSLISFVRL